MKDFENVKGKLAEQGKSQASPVAQPNQTNMQFLNDQYNDLLNSGTRLEEEIGKLSRKLHSLAKDVAIDNIFSYSYQDNIRIVGVSQIKETNLPIPFPAKGFPMDE